MLAHALVALSGAFLLFLLEPMAAKAILPWFGGAPAVWTTCLVFFQALLLAGYAYAHAGRRLGARQQAIVHVGLLGLSLATLPVLPSTAWKPPGGDLPIARIVAALAAGVGVPYLVLASTTPLLQAWLARHDADPRYRLYAWSNAGSLLALVGYPLVVERYTSLAVQAWAWSAAYVVFAAACGWLALRPRTEAAPAPAGAGADAGATATHADADADADARLTAGTVALWFGLAACGSGLLLAITNQLTLDVAVVPLLFIAPLAIYLVSFIVAFAGRYRSLAWRTAYPFCLAAMALVADAGVQASLSWQVAAALATLTAGCMVCHGELARLAPAPRHATAYYLTMAAGGAAGGASVAIVAPLVFTELWELPVFLLLPPLLRLAIFLRDPTWRERPRVRAAAVAGTILLTIAGAILLARPLLDRPGVELASSRSFYGTLRVVDLGRGLPIAQRRLVHGRIEHGAQLLDPARRDEPISYYGHGTGLDLAIRHHPRRVAGQPLRIGVIGLGAGTIAALGARGDSIRFFELDPQVAADARRWFTFLADSPATVDVVLGDGRLSLERELREPAAPRYDVLVVDAFLGDAIPVHLLTRECAAIYGRALADDGVLVVHVSNRNLDLVPVVRGLAEALGRVALRVDRDGGGLAERSRWMLVTSNPAYLALRSSGRTTVDLPLDPPVRWTDGYSSLVGVLTW